MKLILVAAALSAVSYAQIDMAKITDCSGLFDDCRVGPDANMATCAAANAQCEQCQTDYDQCRAPGNGVSGNQAGCAAQVANCVGSAYPSLKAEATASSSAAATSATATDSDDCQSAYKVCVAGGTSEELCGCDLATCTGEDNARTRDYCASISSAGLAATASATATAAAASASSGSTDDCQSTWSKCVASGRNEELCSCDLAVCTGEDSARNRAYCATLSATATGAAATGATGLATTGAARPTASAGGAGSNSTSSTPIVTGAAASVGFSIFGAASAFVSYLLI
ncbi:hypothetical protein Daus18300_002106 [Diaporthe australafricana]|uniref:Uncharacterized protein n=1 Tax=Diaporthe australafricana TaxID=127596 RepID=A0ABR3XR26_9PEZI